ncbi:HD domain-containing protein [Fervidobacterium gondwanense]|uniref:HD domain-containing protein n=1 Tax=Fervidobacterium gondwanense TaxID=44754 RepID=UPI003A69A1EF
MFLGKGTFLFSLTNLFTIQRWNNRPALIRFTEADNSFNTFFLSFIFHSLDQQDDLVQNWAQSIEDSLRWRLSRELPKIVLSDVSLQLKERIERFAPDVWNKVKLKAIDELKNVADEQTVNTLINVDSYSRLDKLADLYTSYLEARENGKLYDFSQPLRELNEKIDEISQFFPKERIETYWQVAQYVWSPLLNLTSMVRWNRTHRNVRTSVSGHSFIVVTIAYLLSKLLEFDKTAEVIVRSILHDLPEAFTGDVITPTKKKVQGLDELVALVEKEMLVEWISENPNLEFMKNYVDFAVEPFEGDAGRIVRTADYFAALLECAVEIHSGNRLEVFRENFFNFKKAIKEISPLDVSSWIDEIETIVF